MPESVSVHDFEVWYRRWYSRTRSESSGYIIESSVKEELKDGDEIIVYAYPKRNKDASLRRVCLLKEVLDKSTERNLNKLIKSQKDLYGVNDESGFNLLIQKLIIAYDLSESLRTGKVYSSFSCGKSIYDAVSSIDDNGKSRDDMSGQPLWKLKCFDVVSEVILNERREGEIDTQRSGYDISFYMIPPLNIILRPQTQTLPDGTIERYYPPVFPNTPFFSFVTSLVYYHGYKSKMRDFINKLRNQHNVKRLNNSTSGNTEQDGIHTLDKLENSFWHSPDWRTVILNRKTFPLTKQQSVVVEMLWNDYVDGGSGLSEDYILTQIRMEKEGKPPKNRPRLRDTFRRLDNWQQLVVKGEGRDIFRLNIDPEK